MKLNRKAIMKGRGRIWLLCYCQDLGFVFFLFWQNSFGVCFFLFNSNSLYKCYFKLPDVYIIMSFEKKLFFFHFCYLGIFKDRATVCKTTHSHIYALMWIFLFSLPDWEINEIIQEYFVRDAIKSLYWFQCISAIILKLCVTFQ